MATAGLGSEILYLTQQDVVDVGLTRGDVINLVRKALSEHGNKSCEMPAKIGIHPLEDTLMHAMSSTQPTAPSNSSSEARTPATARSRSGKASATMRSDGP